MLALSQALIFLQGPLSNASLAALTAISTSSGVAATP
jgi:hypothetical protein